MDIKNEIKGLIYTAGFTLSDVAKQMGDISVQNLSQKISRGTLKYSELKEILEIIGYEIKINKRNGE